MQYLAVVLSEASAEAFRHVLTVTFTNLATAEMKGRILTFLYRMGHGTESEDLREAVETALEERGVRLPETVLRERARNALTAILHDFSYFRVETIDSFLQSVMRNLARELGLNARLRVELNDDELVGTAVDRLVEGLRDGDDGGVRRWIGELLQEELDNGHAWNVASAVKSFAGCIFDEAFQERPDSEREALRSAAEIERFVAEMKRTVAVGKEVVTAAVDGLERWMEGQELNLDRISHGKDYRNLLELMRRLEAPKMGARVHRALYEDCREMLRKGDEQLEDAARETSERLRSLWERYEEIYRDVFTSRLALADIHRLRLLGMIEDETLDVAEENNQFPLSRTPALLSRLVGNSDAPFVFEKAGNTFQHVMIDEFQDTSRMQWRNFRVLLVENLASTGSDLVVGDVKQSIYRWRNGDWRILQEIEKDYSLPCRPNVERLDRNFRSERRIVEFNNRFFLAAAAILDNKEAHRPSLSDLYADAAQKPVHREEKGFVSMRLFRGKKKNEESYREWMAEELAERIREMLRRGVKPGEMAILVRENKEGAEVIRRLQELAPEIRLVSDEAFVLGASRAVRTIVAALRCLSNPKDRISATYLEMSADFAFDETERDELLKMPLYLLCEELCSRIGTEGTKGEEAHLNAFFDTLQDFLFNGNGDMASFLKAWDETLSKKPVPVGNVDGVRVMTIHKSKGLEFHTVFLPATHWNINKQGQAEKRWMKASDARFNALGPLPIQLKKDLSASYYDKEYAEEMFQKRVDALNLLYVAFTRAEKNLLLWGLTQADEEEKSTLNDSATAAEIVMETLRTEMKADDDIFWYEEGEPVGGGHVKADDAEISVEENDENRMDLSHGKPLELPFVTRKPKMNFVQSNESQRFVHDLTSEEPLSYTDIGKVLHYVLSLIRTEDDIPRILRQSLSEGIITDEKMFEMLSERLKKGFRNEMVKDWFSDGNEVFNETNIIGLSKHRPNQHCHRPDRIVIKGNQISVIDYKFARPDSEHHNQVKAYVDLMQQMYPDHTVKGYLWYLYSGHIENVNP